MLMRPAVTYTLCDTSSREQTGDIITFEQFEEGGLLTKTCYDAESGENAMPIQLCHHYRAKKKWMP